MIKTSSGHISNQVLHLKSWPPVSRLLQENAANITRICALLARRPSVGMLIPVMLKISPAVVYSLLEALHASGHIYSASALAPVEPVLSSAEPVQDHEPAVISFLVKLWNRLVADDTPKLASS